MRTRDAQFLGPGFQMIAQRLGITRLAAAAWMAFGPFVRTAEDVALIIRCRIAHALSFP